MKEFDAVLHWNFNYRNHGIKPNPDFLPLEQQEKCRQWLKQIEKKH